MNNHIYLTKAPTKEDYFQAKLYDIPFVVSSHKDIIRFNLINFEHDLPFDIAYYFDIGNTYTVWDVKFKNNIDVLVKDDIYDIDDAEIHLVVTYGYTQYYYKFDKTWLTEYYPNIKKRIFEVHHKLYVKLYPFNQTAN